MTHKKNFDQNNLIRFLVIAFVFSWMIWGLGVVLSYSSDADLPLWIVLPIIIIGAFGPFVGSVWCTYKSGGREEVKTFLKRGIKIKEIPGWIWMAIFLIPICTMLVTIYIVNLVYAEGGLSLTGIFILPFYIILMYLGGSLQEEYGWRGFALDRLQAKWNALFSSIVLGFIWASWHLPLFYIKGAHQQNMHMGLFFISTIMIAIIMTWLHNNSNSNIFVAMTFHSIGNAIIIIAETEGVGRAAMKAGEMYHVIAQIVIALLIVIIWGPKTLTRSTSSNSHG